MIPDICKIFSKKKTIPFLYCCAAVDQASSYFQITIKTRITDRMMLHMSSGRRGSKVGPPPPSDDVDVMSASPVQSHLNNNDEVPAPHSTSDATAVPTSSTATGDQSRSGGETNAAGGDKSTKGCFERICSIA
jgi:hypothetical protein